MRKQSSPGMVPCSVAFYHSAWLVTFDDGATLLLQTDYDQASFAGACGLVETPEDWDGCSSKLGKAWDECDPSMIHECPDEYKGLAEPKE